jgi:hypothetical protein
LGKEYDKMKKEGSSSLLSSLKNQLWLIRDKKSIIYKIISAFTKACCYLPKPIRKRVLSFIDNYAIISSRLFSIIGHITIRAYSVKGKEKLSGEKLKILFIGDEKVFPYISSKLFLKEPSIEKKFKINLWNLKKEINNLEDDVNAVFVKSDRFFSSYFEKQGFTVIPEWISSTLDISGSFENINKKFSKSIKEDIRKIKKHGYTCEISGDPEKLKMFYHKMYIPYITWKYGEFGRYANFFTIKHFFERGSKILFIKKDNEYMFGGLFLENKNRVFATYAGVMEGKFDSIQNGVIAGSYYYLIKHSKKIGANVVDLGSCRPFVNDGVFSYKRKWGTNIEKTGSENPEIYSLKVLNKNKGIETFLSSNPFVTIENNQIKTDAFNHINGKSN